MKTTVAIVEDDPILTFLLAEICKANGYDVVGTAASVAEATALLLAERPEVLILDYSLDGEEDGLELLAAVKRIFPAMVSLLVTGWDFGRLEQRIDFIAPDHLLQKPLMPSALAATLTAIAQGLREAEIAPISAPTFAHAA